MDSMIKVIKAGIAAISAFVLAKFGALAPFFWIILGAMVLDYGTGMAAAWTTSTLNSRRGIVGIIKKVGYVVLIAVALMLDWAIRQAGGVFGFSIPEAGFIVLLVMAWLLINEVISILENLGEIGLDYPDWLLGLLKRLKQTVDKQGEQLDKMNAHK